MTSLGHLNNNDDKSNENVTKKWICIISKIFIIIASIWTCWSWILKIYPGSKKGKENSSLYAHVLYKMLHEEASRHSHAVGV